MDEDLEEAIQLKEWKPSLCENEQTSTDGQALKGYHGHGTGRGLLLGYLQIEHWPVLFRMFEVELYIMSTLMDFHGETSYLVEPSNSGQENTMIKLKHVILGLLHYCRICG